MYSFNYYGQANAVQRVAPANVVFGVSPYCYEYKEFTFTFNSGGTTTCLPGHWIKGATTGCQAKIISISDLTAGTSWGAGTAAGTMRIGSVHGSATSEKTYFDGTENITVLTTANNLTMTGTLQECQDNYIFKNQYAKAMIVNVMTQTLLCNWDGSIPDQNQLIGISIAAGNSLLLTDLNNIKDFKFVDRVSGTTGLIELQFYF